MYEKRVRKSNNLFFFDNKFTIKGCKEFVKKDSYEALNVDFMFVP